MPFYKPNSLTIQQVKHLLAIYHGETSIDLDSTITTHATRSKLTNPRKETEGNAFISDLELLVTKQDNNSADFEALPLAVLLEILSNHEKKITKGSAEHLLFKRLAALSFYGMKTLISFQGLLNTVCPIVFSRVLNMCGIQVVASTSCGLVTLQWINSWGKALELSTFEQEQLHSLQIKLQEYCAIKSVMRIPKIIPVYGLNASYNTAKDESFIYFGIGLLNLLDIEEQHAVLAHELGHAKSGELSLSGARNIHLGILFFSMLLERFDVPYAQAIQLIVLIISVILMNTCYLHPEEHQADESARELAGPLAHASTQWSLQCGSANQKNAYGFFTLNNKRLAGFVETIGLDDVFSTHPSCKKRM